MSEREALVLAVPRRELYAIRGFSSEITVPVLESLQQETWFAHASSIENDVDVKCVQFGLLVRRDEQWLVGESGILLHTAPIQENVARFGEGLGAIRRLAHRAGSELMATAQTGIELIGLFNEDRLPETRAYLILIYVLTVPARTAAPEGMVWVTARHLADLGLDPVSTLLVDYCRYGR
ncbi:MAG: hypothetical protein ACOCXA_09505 [Planctomycetota bacterium]